MTINTFQRAALSAYLAAHEHRLASPRRRRTILDATVTRAFVLVRVMNRLVYSHKVDDVDFWMRKFDELAGVAS